MSLGSFNSKASKWRCVTHEDRNDWKRRCEPIAWNRHRRDPSACFFSERAPALALGHTDSGGEQVQRWLPGTRVVKAFNIINHAYMDCKARLPRMLNASITLTTH